MEVACRLPASLCASTIQLRSFGFSLPLKKTHYEILGVKNKATLKEIKEAYYKQSKICHPDNKGNGSTDDFVALKQAYDTLRRPADRKLYDNYLAGVPNCRSRSRSHNYQGQNWNNYWESSFYQPFAESAKARQEQELRSWRNIFWFTLTGVVLITFYNIYYWRESVRRERRIQNLVAKDEIAKSFLRQREYKHQLDDNLQIDYFAQLLRTDIENAQRLRDEERKIMDERNPLEIREEHRWFGFVTTPHSSKQQQYK